MADKEKQTRKEKVFEGMPDDARKQRLLRRYEGLAKLEQQLFLSGRLLLNGERASSLDGLTGLMNRRYGMRRCMHLVEAIKRHNTKHSDDPSKHQSLAVLFVDLDKFKAVNDTYGHLTGDKVLKVAAECIKKSLRSDDSNVAMRYGGEEFVIVLKIDAEGDSSAEDRAKRVAERVRKMVRKERISFKNASGMDAIHCQTASLGVAVEEIGSLESRSVEDILAQALEKGDQALYVAKKTGRDRVCVYDPKVPRKPDAEKKINAPSQKVAHG